MIENNHVVFHIPQTEYVVQIYSDEYISKCNIKVINTKFIFNVGVSKYSNFVYGVHYYYSYSIPFEFLCEFIVYFIYNCLEASRMKEIASKQYLKFLCTGNIYNC